VVDQVKAEYDVEVEWLPFLLRPDMPEEGQAVPAAIKAKRAQSEGRLKQMAQAQGLPMVSMDWTPNPRLAHEATVYAGKLGKGEAFHRAVFRMYFGEGKDIGKWDILRAAATEVELDVDAMQREVASGAYRQIVEEQIAEAYAIGVNSVPTYVLNDRYGIVGAQPFVVFKRTIERISAEPEPSDDRQTD
jgi:predicted DsbA family dithiol-disulfide isomerase